MADKRAVVIGGGFFGCATAIHLAQQGWRVDVLEQGDELMQRASYVNQARLHNGYHYPRSFQTAIRSRANMPQFCELYPQAVFTEFRPLYAIDGTGRSFGPGPRPFRGAVRARRTRVRAGHQRRCISQPLRPLGRG